MAFGKSAKTPKSQYQTETQSLGRYAYDKINPQLDRIGELTNNADDYRKSHINDYFNSSASWNDAMRNYRRQSAAATANNYAATGGGYSSAGQRLYDDMQRNLNDYNARLYDQGVNTVEGMLGVDRAAAQNYYNTLVNQHAMAREGDLIDVQNQLVDKANKNGWTSLLNSAGDVASLFGPWGKAIGAAMKVGSWAGSTNYNNALNSVNNQLASIQNTRGGQGSYISNVDGGKATVNDIFGGVGDAIGSTDWYKNLVKKKGW